VAQGVGPEFKLQYHKKNKQKQGLKTKQTKKSKSKTYLPSSFSKKATGKFVPPHKKPTWITGNKSYHETEGKEMPMCQL
jgi:hypothetical protein